MRFISPALHALSKMAYMRDLGYDILSFFVCGWHVVGEKGPLYQLEMQFHTSHFLTSYVYLFFIVFHCF